MSDGNILLRHIYQAYRIIYATSPKDEVTVGFLVRDHVGTDSEGLDHFNVIAIWNNEDLYKTHKGVVVKEVAKQNGGMIDHWFDTLLVVIPK